MTNATARKPIEEMLVSELKAELDEAGVEYASRESKKNLRSLVAEERSAEHVVGEAEEEVEVEEVEEARRLPAVRASEAMIARGEVSAAEVVVQRDKIRQVMEAVMKNGVHYGEIPGISKPTLLKPGAEVLAVTFRLAPSYKSERVFHDDGHLTVVTAAKLTHIPTGLVVAEGEGLCTTREKKYAYRGEGRTCPACGATGTIKRSKFPPRETDYEGARASDAPGWYCHGKAGGCGANYAATDPRIADQQAEKVPNPDLPDTWNTVLKMANKRALVAAILNGTAASDIFTQDVEDAGEYAADTHETAAPARGAAQAPAGAKLPRTLAEVGAIAAEYGDELGWREWLLDACEALYGTREWGDLTADQRNDVGRRAAGAIVALREAKDPAEMPPVTRAEVQRAWASVLDGKVLPGPGWRFSPEEADIGVPTYAEFHGQDEPEPQEPSAETVATEHVDAVDPSEYDNAGDDLDF